MSMSLDVTQRRRLEPRLAAVDDADSVVVSTARRRRRSTTSNVIPSVALRPERRFFGDWMQLDGTAEIVALPEAMDGLVDYYDGCPGSIRTGDDYRRAMERERRVAAAITVERAGPDRSG